MSAAGKAILARQQAQAAEEAALKKLQDEEDERIRIQEEKEEAEKAAADAIREKNRIKKAEKIEKQKAAGTYMTKAEKEKAKKAQARVEAMKSAGMLNVEGESSAASAAPKSSAAMFSKKKNKKNSSPRAATASSVAEKESNVTIFELGKEDELAAAIHIAVGDTISLPVLDSWDDAGSDDDWESGLKALKVSAVFVSRSVHLTQSSRLKTQVSSGIGDEEDALQAEKEAEQKKLKELGLERARRAEEERLKR